jgi:hypothetical protein
MLLCLLALWFLGQFITDVYRHTPLLDMEKGLALIAFFAIDLVALAILLNWNQRRLLLFAIGFLPALIAQCFEHGYQALRPDLAWKLGLAPILNPAVILLACYFFKRRNLIGVCVLEVLVAAVNLYLNYRSAALIIGISLILVLQPRANSSQSAEMARQLSKIHTAGLHGSKSRAVLTLALVMIMGYVISSLYSFTASSGLLGADAKLKYDLESRGKYGLLVGGRPETLVSGLAVLDSPILGHGSWAKDSKYSEILSDQLRATGYAENDLESRYGDPDSTLIPTHSHLMTAWVFSGILGAVFWFYVIGLCVRSVLTLSKCEMALSPYFSYLLISSLWDIFFSPFASYRRLLMAYVLVVINLLLSHAFRGNNSATSSEIRPPTLRPVMPRFRHSAS